MIQHLNTRCPKLILKKFLYKGAVINILHSIPIEERL